MDTPKVSEDVQRGFFEAGLSRARDAESRVGAIEHVLCVAGKTVRLVFAGAALEQLLMPAIAHLRVDASTPADAVFHVWDSESTGVHMAPPPCTRAQFTDRGDVWGFVSETYRFAFHWIECSVNLFNRDTHEAVWWVQSAKGLPYWTKASPFRSLFQWWLELHGKQLMHAAAIGDQNGAVLLTGKGGVGKSTTALSALSAGLSYVGDDYLIADLDPEPRLHSLYSTAKLNRDQVMKFPDLAAHIVNLHQEQDEKAVLRLFPAVAGQIAANVPMRAIMTPRFGNESETRVLPVSADALCRASAFTTMSQLPYSGRHTIEFIQRMVDTVPGFELALGKDLPGVIDAIASLLQKPDAEIRRLSRSTDTDPYKPLITVVVPVYNGARFLLDAIDSIRAQGHEPIEIIVVDDGSVDDIDAAIAALPIDVRFFKQPNSGPSAARNRGIMDASGDFIAFLDVDDLWPEGNLKRLLTVMRQDQAIDVVHGFGQLMHHDEQSGRFTFSGSPREAFPYYIGAGLYRREAFRKVGLFDVDLPLAEDTDWYQRAYESELNVQRIEEVTLHVRRHGDNMTAQKTDQELAPLRVFKKRLDRLRRTQGDAEAVSAWAGPQREAPRQGQPQTVR